MNDRIDKLLKQAERDAAHARIASMISMLLSGIALGMAIAQLLK